MQIRLIMAMLCCLLVTSAHAARVESVRSYRAPDHTRVVFDLSDTVEHKVFSLENPDRLVIDLRDAELQDELSGLDLSDTPISAIRSAARNDNDLRVVLDLNAKVRPRSFLLPHNEKYGDRLVVDLHDTAPTARRPRTPPRETESARRDIVVAISPGHGGEDPGAIGVDRLQEKQVVLALSREIQRIIDETPGYRAVMIRTGDYYVDLRRRTAIAHEHNADLFIAIHADAFTNSKASGTTIYALSRSGATSEHARRLAEKENSADLIGGVGSVSLNDKDEVLASVLLDLSMTASIASSLEVGDRIIASLSRVTKMRRMNVEQAAFVVLKSPDIPSLLIEAGYITNPTDARNLNSSAHRKKFARAMVDGITDYFHDTPPRGTLVAWQKENGGKGVPGGHYQVRSGDTLSEIARRFDVSVDQLRGANGLAGNQIRVGQELVVPGRNNYLEHTISRGETLSGIASSYAVPLQKIRETNQLNDDTIRVGQVLRIPSS